MSDDVVHRRMPKSRKVTIIIMLAMATANSVTLIVTLIRPVPQFSVSGTLMQLGATKEATLARRGVVTEPVVDNSTDSLWPPPDDFQNVQNAWHTSATLLDDLTISKNTVNLPRDIFATEIAIPSSLPSLRPRSPCAKKDCGDDYYFKDPKPKPKPKPENEKLPQKVASPEAHIEMVLGMLGICIMRVEGTTACSKAAFSIDYKPVFEQANLDEDIIAVLPSSPGAWPVILLFGTLLYLASAVVFTYTLTPPFLLTDSNGVRKSVDSRHQVALAISSIVATGGLVLVLIPTFVLRNRFITSINAIPAINENLQVKLGTGFTQLYMVCIIGGLTLVQCLSLIAEDLRFPWWYTQSHGSIRRNPFDTTERGIAYTGPEYPRARRDHRWWDEKTGKADWVVEAYKAKCEADKLANNQPQAPPDAHMPSAGGYINALPQPQGAAGYRNAPATGQI